MPKELKEFIRGNIYHMRDKSITARKKLSMVA